MLKTQQADYEVSSESPVQNRNETWTGTKNQLDVFWPSVNGTLVLTSKRHMLQMNLSINWSNYKKHNAIFLFVCLFFFLFFFLRMKQRTEIAPHPRKTKTTAWKLHLCRRNTTLGLIEATNDWISETTLKTSVSGASVSQILSTNMTDPQQAKGCNIWTNRKHAAFSFLASSIPDCRNRKLTSPKLAPRKHKKAKWVQRQALQCVTQPRG